MHDAHERHGEHDRGGQQRHARDRRSLGLFRLAILLLYAGTLVGTVILLRTSATPGLAAPLTWIAGLVLLALIALSGSTTLLTASLLSKTRLASWFAMLVSLVAGPAIAGGVILFIRMFL